MVRKPLGEASREGHAKEGRQGLDQPDMTVGSKSWAAKTVCDHYCGEGKPARVVSDGTPLIVYNCPWCSRDDLVLDLALGTVRCSGRGCMAKVDHLEFLAAVEGLDFCSGSSS